jgi:CRISPR-associated endonuclease/helicase Cas3
MSLALEQFEPFFFALNGVTPFPWQVKLAERVCMTGWPGGISLPTAAGKTAVIDIAVFAMAVLGVSASRRVFFIVDRRIVVDEAFDRATKLAKKLSQAQDGVLAEAAAALRLLGDLDGLQKPLQVASLRGGRLRDDAWTRSPLQPLVCCSTVDQIGSALLFRSYGARSSRNWPIHAALAGRDSLFILDEAHLSTPLVETAEDLPKMDSATDPLPGCGLTVVTMSATLGKTDDVFRSSERDRSDPTFKLRIEAPKLTTLDECAAEELVNHVVQHALQFAKDGHRVIAVVVNRVLTARRVFDRLKQDSDALLLVGRCRPWDRDTLWKNWQERIEVGRVRDPIADQTCFIVATQCIEVGANVDFDALVTEAASLDALRQRFGRLDRLGQYQRASAVIVHGIPVDKEQQKSDPIYGDALKNTWRQLKKWASGGKKGKKGKGTTSGVDFGVAAMDLLQNSLGTEDTLGLAMPVKHAPVLLPVHLDVLAQTNPQPEPDIEPGVFLHGPESGTPDVELVWRADLSAKNREYWDELVGSLPPSSMERMSVPFMAVKHWLATGSRIDMPDLEGIADAPDREGIRQARQALCWRGAENSVLVEPKTLRPGMLIVVPSEYGGADKYGWNPESREPVEDIADEMSLRFKGRPVIRLAPALTCSWTSVAESLRRPDEDSNPQDSLTALACNESIPQWLRTAADYLARDGNCRFVTDPLSEKCNDPRYSAIIASRVWKNLLTGQSEEDFEQESMASALTREIGLDLHQAGVAEKAKRFATCLQFGVRVSETLHLAGRTHDLGKADPRFQRWLRNGSAEQSLLAKSNLPRSEMRRSRIAAGWPKGGRHELTSVRLAMQLREDLLGKIDRDLLLHLVASHHGYCRPFAPFVKDEASIDFVVPFDGDTLTTSNRHELERFGSGVADRYWLLTKRYGRYGLALLETVLRLADHQQSTEEQET